MKKTIIAAIVVSGSLIGGNMSSAQQTAPNNRICPMPIQPPRCHVK